MTMKENENQNATFCDSRNFKRNTDPSTFGSKEINESEVSVMNVDLLAFETKARDENLKDVDDISVDNGSGSTDSPRKDGQNGHSYRLSSWEIDSSPDMYGKDHKQISPEHEGSVTVKEFILCNGNEYGDSNSRCESVSDLFETVANVFTDKNVLECELPEFEVMKDICVDSGRPENDKYLLETLKDDKVMATHFYFPSKSSIDDDYCEAKEALSVGNANGHTADHCGSGKDNDGELVDQGMLKSENHTTNLEELVHTGNAGFGETNSSEEGSLVDKKHPIQEYSTQRTSLDSLGGEGNKLMQLFDQIPIGKSVSEEDVQANSPTYNSKVESGRITFNFSDNVQAQCTSSSVGLLHEESLSAEDKNPNTSSASSEIHSLSSKNSNDENGREQQKDIISDDFSSDSQVQSASDKSQCSTNDDAPAVEPSDGSKQEHRNSVNDNTAVSQWQYEQGETSFSAVTYSGPIALSGSLSHRSDASTTSARSFAFPVITI
ncbi:hypothetical protein OROGR_000520 [Orobanche gracilis]